MFVLQKDPQFVWPVTVRVPTEDGKLATQRCRARFRLVPLEEIEELGRSGPRSDEVLRKIVVELLDIVDADQRPIPHSADLLDACIANPWLRAGLMAAYLGAVLGAEPSPAAEGN